MKIARVTTQGSFGKETTMRVIRIDRLLLAGLLLVAATGCASQQLDPRVARSMVDLRRDLSGAKAQLERTTSTLADIAKNPRLNTDQQVQFFDEEMEKLETSVQHVRDVATQMDTNTERYFNAWNKEMGELHDPQLASAAKDRNAASRKAVETVQKRLDALKEDGAPMMSALRDLQRYFKNDRTGDAAHAAVPTIQKTLAQKNRVNTRIDEAIAEIDSVTKTVE
jgi:hypothetical protein